MSYKHFEVLFRGKEERGLLAWRPTPDARFECTASEARERFDDLVESGIDGVAVDGVVPYVVEIRQVRRKYVRSLTEDRIKVDTMLWQYAEPEAELMGPWATEEEKKAA